ncbi:MAG: HNH endonuclease [Solirubrobacteraceae bacterium]
MVYPTPSPCLECDTVGCRRHGRRAPSPSTRVRRGHAWRKVRADVLARDSYVCQLDLPGCTWVATVVDHVVPVARGGAALDPANLRAACSSCNARKGAR